MIPSPDHQVCCHIYMQRQHQCQELALKAKDAQFKRQRPLTEALRTAEPMCPEHQEAGVGNGRRLQVSTHGLPQSPPKQHRAIELRAKLTESGAECEGERRDTNGHRGMGHRHVAIRGRRNNTRLDVDGRFLLDGMYLPLQH